MDGKPEFDKKGFIEIIKKLNIDAVRPSDLTLQLIKPLQISIITPGATCGEGEFLEIYKSILDQALNHLFPQNKSL